MLKRISYFISKISTQIYAFINSIKCGWIKFSQNTNLFNCFQHHFSVLFILILQVIYDPTDNFSTSNFISNFHCGINELETEIHQILDCLKKDCGIATAAAKAQVGWWISKDFSFKNPWFLLRKWKAREVSHFLSSTTLNVRRVNFIALIYISTELKWNKLCTL